MGAAVPQACPSQNQYTMYIRRQLEALHQLSPAFNCSHGGEQRWWAMYKNNVFVIMTDVFCSSLTSDMHFTAWEWPKHVQNEKTYNVCHIFKTPVAQTKLSKPPGTFACTDQFLAKQKATTNFCATTMLKLWCWYFALSSFRAAAVFINGALEWAGQKRRLTINNQYYVIDVALMLLVATNVSLLR